MRRQGCDPENVLMSDVLCDFCGREWTDSLPMVEGHQGSCICGDCLADAYRAVALTEPTAGAAAKCVLCLEERQESTWSPTGAEAPRACRRCVRQSAAVLQKDGTCGWRKPER